MQRLPFLIGLPLLALAFDASAAPRDAEQVDVDRDHGCVVTSCGEVDCWGRDDWGQASDRRPTVGLVLIGTPVVPEFEAVSVGQYHTCALDEHGAVDCWGKGNYGQSADRGGPFIDLAAGANHNCAIRASDGGIECWGANVHGASNPPSGAFADVSAGMDYGCAVEVGGQNIRCWGYNAYGQAPATLEALNYEAGEVFTAVSAGRYHTCAVTDWYGGEAVYCWGYGPYASLGGYAAELEPGVYFLPYYDALQVDSGAYGAMVTRLVGGDPEVFGYGWTTNAYPITSGTEALDIALGANHWCLVDPLGNVSCEGNNAYGKRDAPLMSGNCRTGFWQPRSGPTLPNWP